MTFKETFVEVRLFVSTRDGKPEDLSLVTAALLLVPKSGPPLKRDLQLMMPDPPLGLPSIEPQALSDGHQVRVAVADSPGAFQFDRTAGAAPSVYFKADVPAELATKDSRLVVLLHFPAGRQVLELKSLFDH